MSVLRAISGSLQYSHIIGTGGIGSGIFFSLEGNDTLGREESRMASLLPYKDYCKLHIILHYISVLLGNEKFECVPIGSVGNDEPGKKLIEEMKRAGMNVDYVKISEEYPTLFSVCYQYPDRDGGNITTLASASSNVSYSDIDQFFSASAIDASKEIILAVPEVPVATRIKLLAYGKERGSLNVSAVSSSEIETFVSAKGIELTDLLFINSHEAAKFASTSKSLINKAIENIVSLNPSITVFITEGAHGVHCHTGGKIEFIPSVTVDVKSTAGAGDAFMGGTLCGITCGLSVTEAARLGTIVAAMSVTSQDTINHKINADSVAQFIANKQLDIPVTLQKLIPSNVAH